MVPSVSPIFVGISVTCHIKRTVFNRHLTTNEPAPLAGLLCDATPLRVGGGVDAAAPTELELNAIVVVVTVCASAAASAAAAAAAAADASEMADEYVDDEKEDLPLLSLLELYVQCAVNVVTFGSNVTVVEVPAHWLAGAEAACECVGDVCRVAMDARVVAVVAVDDDNDGVECVESVLMEKLVDVVRLVAVSAALWSGVAVSSVISLLIEAILIGI